MRYHFTPSRMATIKKWTVTSAGQMWRKLEFLSTALGNSIWQLLNKLNTELPYDPAIPPKYRPKRKANMSTQNLFTSVNSCVFMIAKDVNNLNVHQLMNG